MVRFILRCGTVLSLMLLILCILLAVRLTVGSYRVRTELALRPQTRVISVSDSHGWQALREEEWPGLQKFSRHSLEPWQVLMRLNIILRDPGIGRVRAALFTLSSHTFSRLAFTESQRTQFTEFFPLTYPMRHCWPYAEPPMRVRDWINLLSNSFRTADFVSPIPAAQDVSLFETQPDKPFLETVLDFHYGSRTTDPAAEADAEARYRKVYAAIVRRCQEHGIRPVFVSTPVHPAYRRGVPAAAERRLKGFRDFLRSLGATVLDFRDRPMEQNEYYDGDHLSLKGRIRFTRMLRELPEWTRPTPETSNRDSACRTPDGSFL